MRVTQVIALYPPDFRGGATLVCEHLGRALAARGHRVSVVAGRTTAATPVGDVTRDEVDGIPVTRINVGPALDAWSPENFEHRLATRAFGEILDTERPDVLHVHSIQGLGVGIIDAAVRRGVRVVWTLHDWWCLCPCLFRLSPAGEVCARRPDPASCSGRPGYDFARRSRVMRRGLDGADLLLTPSAFLRDELIHNGVDGDRIRVQENGIPAATNAPPPADDGPARFVYIGGAGNREKGLGVLAAAVEQARDLDYRLDAYSVGDEDLSRWPGLRDPSVTHHGAFPPEGLDDALAGADALILPSLMRESFSLVAREALLRGRPVITSDCGGPEEVVRDGENGLVVPTGDAGALATAMRRFATDPALRRALQSAAPATFPTPADQAADAEGVYRAVLRGAAVRGGSAPGRADRRRAVSKVLLLSGIDGAPLRHRGWNLADGLATRGIRCEVLPHADPRATREVRGADVLILFRTPWCAAVRQVVEIARARRVPVVFSADDLVFDPADPGEAPVLDDDREGWAEGFRKTLDWYARSFGAADAFLASTDELAAHADGLGKPAHAWRNRPGRAWEACAGEALARGSDSPDVSFAIGYFSGTDTHDRDLARITPTLARVLDRIPGTELVLGGPLRVPPELEERAGRVRRVPLRSWDRLPAELARVDVSLAPLETERAFNRAKSEVKYLEAATVGVPTLASPTPSFERACRGGATGLLADDHAEWESALVELALDPAWASELGAGARRDVVERYGASAGIDDLVDWLSGLSATEDPAPLPSPVEMEAGEGACTALDARTPYAVDRTAFERGEGLHPGAEVRQDFVSERDGLWRVDVRVGTYVRRNDHAVHLTVRDDRGDVVGARRLAASEMVDQTFIGLELREPVASSAGRRFSIEASAPQAGDGNEILLWEAPAEGDAGDGLTIGGRSRPGRSLSMRAFGALPSGGATSS